MALDFTVYCKKEPNPADLVNSLSAIDCEGSSDGVRLLNCNVGEDQGVEINVYLKPSIERREYNREHVNRMIADARARGFDIPEELVEKLEEDGRAFYEEYVFEHDLSPTTTYDAPYVVKVDEELLAYLTEYPHLREALPEFSMEFDLVCFSGGAELYPVGLTTFIGSDVDKASSMAVLAMEIAEKYDGLLYDPQSDSVGVPDIEKMVESASAAFAAVSGILESGLERLFDSVGEEPEEDAPPTIH